MLRHLNTQKISLKKCISNTNKPKFSLARTIISHWKCCMCKPCTEHPLDSQAMHRGTQNCDTLMYLTPTKLITIFTLKCGLEGNKKCFCSNCY